jgi:TPR repeat protein
MPKERPLMRVTIVGAAVAGTFDAAQSAFRAGDKVEGYRLTRLAAEEGDAQAQTTLGYFYSSGRGVAKSDAEATKWFRRAAEQGDDEAQFNLAGAYLFGLGVRQDYIEAHKWAHLASRAADETTRQLHLDLLKTIEEKLTPEQIAEAQKLTQ